jgi:molecular chaperone GrpE
MSVYFSPSWESRMEENEQLEKIKSGNGSAAEEAEFSGDPEVAVSRPEGSPDLTLEQTEDLKSKAAKADEHWNRLLRLTADFDNFKKRSARERHEAIKFANQSILEKLILVLDNFDMALAAANNSQAGSVDSLRAGIDLIYNQLKNVLTEAGLEEVDAAGKPFDPNLHEAVSQQETAEVPEGQVLQQLRKGYREGG